MRQGIPLLALVVAVLASSLLLVSHAPADQGGIPHVSDEIIVKYKKNTTALEKQQIRGELGSTKKKEWGRIRAELQKLDGMTVEEALQRLQGHPRVEYAEPNYIITLDETPNDPQFGSLWGMENTGQTGGTPGADISATNAWDVFTGNGSVVLGVIDTGVDYTHPDLAANIWTNPGEIPGNGIDDDVNGYIDDIHGWDFYNDDNDPMDDHGHGSHVSGTIGAVGDNGLGVAGVTWNVKIMGLKFLSASGSGSTADAVSAVDYATMMGVRLTSNSWGGGGFSQALYDAIDAAGQAGQLFVAAAGNSGSNNDVSPHYPSNYNLDNIVSVAATDHNDAKASFSSYGLTTVDLAAPGVNILSTFPGNNYGSISGTSMATPHVSGALALVFGRFPAIGHLQAKNLILNNVDLIPSMAGITVTGGRLNAFFPIADPDSIAPGGVTDLAVTGEASNSLDVEWTAVGDDGLSGTASSYDLRYSTSPIDDLNWGSATQVSGEPDPDPSGSPQGMTIDGLAFSTLYYVGIKARDEFGNEGPLSNIASGTTLGAPDIDVTPLSLSDVLLTGATSSHVLSLGNVAPNTTLDFEIPVPELLTAPAPVQAYVSIPKGGEDTRTGGPVIEGFGGPDGFGYRWIDSDEAAGPVFNWQDISGTGTAIITTGDDVNNGPHPIGFDFPFYGVNYTSVRVCSNGWLSFNSTATSYDNQGLPNGGAPTALVAPMWDDFVIGSGNVYLENVGGSLIVQWDGVAHYSAGSSYTFQAILNPDGSIVFQYLDVGTLDNSATVGIQNSARTDGLEVAFNTAYLYDGLAVRIGAVPQWVTVTPGDGTILGPGSQNLTVDLDAAGLLGGTYDGNIRINSNDPDEDPVLIPVQLTVIGAPDIDVDPSSHDFGPVFIGATPVQVFSVLNPGTDTLHVSNVTLSDPIYSVNMTAFDVPPQSGVDIEVTFSPAAVAAYPAIMTVYSDDPDQPTVNVSLNGSGVIPPDFSVTPTSLTSNLFTGETETQALTLANGGGADLEWSVGLDFGVSSAVYDLDPADPPVAPLADGEQMPASFTGEPLSAELADLTGVDILWDRSHGQTSTTSWTTMVSDFEARGATVTMSTDPIDAALLSGYDVLWTVDASGDWTAPELAAMANWIAGGGGVLMEGDNTSSVDFYNQLCSHIGAGITFNDASGASGTTSDIHPHPTTENVFGIYYTANVASIDPPVAPAGLLANDTGGTPAAVYSEVGSGRIIGVSDEVFQNSRMDDADNRLFGNQVMDWLAGPAFISLDPTSGIVPPGGSVPLDVLFDASGLFGGVYESDIVISTNDPLAPEVIVPATLNVTGAPDLVLDPTSLDFGEVFVGYPELLDYNVMNGGTDDLTITALSSNNPDFVPDLTGVTLPIVIPPLGSTVLRVLFSPAGPGPQAGTLSILSDDPDTPNQPLALSGTGVLPPTGSVNPDSLHSDLLTGEVEVHQVTLSNTGASDLNWEATLQFNVATGIYTLTAPDAMGADADVDTGEPDAVVGRTTPISAELADLTGVDILWDRSHSNTSPTSWADILADFESRGATVTQNFDPLTATLLNAYDILYVVDNSGTWTASELTALTNWVNGGGGLLLEGDNASTVGNYNDILTALGAGIEFSTTSGSSGTTHDIYPHPTTENVFGVYYTANVASISSITAPAGLLVNDDEGTPAAAYSQVGAGRIFAASDEIFQNSRLDNDDNQLFGNQVIDWLAVPVFLSTDPDAGSIPPGGSQVVDVTFDAGGLFGGDYAGLVRFLTNDPANGVLDVQATLHVTGVPRVGWEPEPLAFGDVFVGYPDTLTLVVTNIGTDHLSVSSMTPGLGSDWSVDPAALELDPNESADVMVAFSPTTDGSRNTQLTIMSNDPDSPHLASLEGNGLFPPIVGSQPDTVEGAAYPGGTKHKTLTVCNTGGSDLVFGASTAIESNTAVTVYDEIIFPKETDEPGGEAASEPDPRSILGTGGPDTFGYVWTDSDEPGGPVYDWVDISGIGTPTDFPPYDIDGTFGPYPIGFDFPFYEGSFGEFYVCNNGWISFTNGTSTAYSNQPLPNSGSSTPENMLAVWWDDNVYDESDGSYIVYHNDGTRLIIEYYVRRIAQGSPPYLNFQIILYPNGEIVYQYKQYGVNQSSCTIGIQNATKDDGLTVVHNDGSYPQEEFAIRFSSGPQWLSVSPESGVIPAGECLDLDVLLDATDLEAGDYTGAIQIASNDPATPVDTTPVLFHVGLIQAVDAQVDPNTINLGSNGRWMNGSAELPAPYDPADVVLETLTLEGVYADRIDLGDFNMNSIEDFTAKFDRTDLESVLPEGDSVEVVMLGEIEDTIWFEARDVIRVIRPQIQFPNGGEVVIIGEPVDILWSDPVGWAVDHADLVYSADGGETWQMIAQNVVGNSYTWTPPEGTTETARVRVYLSDNQGVMGYDSSDDDFVVSGAILDARGSLPTVHALLQNAPNPFLGSTRIAFELPEPGRVDLTIYDVSGRVVRTLAGESMTAGRYEVTWDGQDNAGRSVSSGVYFYHLKAGDFTATRRMSLIK